MDYHFNVEHARRWGVEEAIFLQNLIYWLRHNKANRKTQKDGRTWSYNTLEAFAELFPFWTVRQVRRITTSLITQGVILKGSFNDRAYDRTCWYALADESLLELQKPICPNGQMEKPEPSDGVAPTVTPIPDTKQDQRQREAPTHEPAGVPKELHASLSPLLGRIREEAQARGAPPSFVSKNWTAGILELRQGGIGEEELLEAFKACLERAPDRVTFFPRDFLRWRKISREQLAREQRHRTDRQVALNQDQQREQERTRVLAEQESPAGRRLIQEAVGRLPWKKAREGGA